MELKFIKKISILTLLFILPIKGAFSENKPIIVDNKSSFNISYIDMSNEIKKDSFKDGINTKVYYFFSYGCPYCYDTENYKEKFLKTKKNNIEFIPIPITAIPSWENYTKAFYIAKELNLDIRKNIFKDIHINGNKKLTEEQLYDFFKNYEVSYNDFENSYNSMSLTFKMKKDEKIADLYKVTGTPTFVVTNDFGYTYKTSPSISGGIPDTIASLFYITKSDENGNLLKINK